MLLPGIYHVWAHKGLIVHYKAFGYSHLENRIPVKKDDIFRWASQTKLITTIALMMLYKEGRFFLDDPASPGSLTRGGAYCSEYTIDPKEDLILLVYTNAMPYAYYGELVRKFRILVYQALN